MTDRTLTVKTVKTVDVNDLEYELWCGAQERWEAADEDTREAVFERICDWTADDEEVDMTTVNDIVWFECDDLFFPEEDEEETDDEEEDDEEEDEQEICERDGFSIYGDDEDKKTEENEMKSVNTILIGRISGEFKLSPDGYWENTIVHCTVNNGEETVTFVTVRFRGKQAELAYTHLSKGDLCCIEGRRGEETTDTGVVKQYIEAGHITFLATGRRNND